jgi:hypothetical protein
MKKPDEEMEKTEEGFALHLRSRSVSTVSLQIPVDTLASLEKVAASRDMFASLTDAFGLRFTSFTDDFVLRSPQALMKFYIGQGLRQDLTKLFTSFTNDFVLWFADRVLEKTAQVLTRP